MRHIIFVFWIICMKHVWSMYEAYLHISTGCWFERIWQVLAISGWSFPKYTNMFQHEDMKPIEHVVEQSKKNVWNHRSMTIQVACDKTIAWWYVNVGPATQLLSPGVSWNDNIPRFEGSCARPKGYPSETYPGTTKRKQETKHCPMGSLW